MSVDNYNAAVAYATSHVRKWIDTSPLSEKLGAEEMALRWILGVDFHTAREGSRYLDADNSARQMLGEMATSSNAARNTLRMIVASKLQAGLALCPNEARFAGQLLNNTLPPLPKKPGRKRDENFERNIFIVFLVDDLFSRFGLPPTRGDAAKHHRSGCDAISEAFRRNKRHEVTFKAVKDVHGDRRLRKSANVILEAMQTSARASKLNVLAQL